MSNSTDVIMKNLLFLFSIFYYTTLVAQDSHIEWQNTIGGNHFDRFTSVVQAKDGNYILSGYSNSNISDDKTQNPYGIEAHDFWIVKINSNGNILWQKTIGGDGAEILGDLKLTEDGGIILGGSSASPISGNKTQDTVGLMDFWVVKLDKNGNISWDKVYGGIKNDYLRSMEQTRDNGYILGGISNSDISGNKTENSQGDVDFWVIKIDSVGSIQWQNTIGGSFEDELNSLHQTIDNGFILGGFSGSHISGDKTEDRHGDYDYWIIKLDSIGNIVWQNTIGGDDVDKLNSILLTNDNGYLLTGYSSSNISVDKTENSITLNQSSTRDFWIIKIDNIGNIVWQRTIGGYADDMAITSESTVDGGYIVGGISNSGVSPQKNEGSFGQMDYWIVKLDANGNIEWENTIGGNKEDILLSILPTTEGGYVLGGESASRISGDKLEDSKGPDKDYNNVDYWIVKLRGGNLITGKCFIDYNNNGKFDPNDLSFNQTLLSSKSTYQYTSSPDKNGVFYNYADSGMVKTESATIPYYSSSPSNHISLFNNYHLTDTVNFAFFPQPNVTDLRIYLIPHGSFVAGRELLYTLKYINVGTVIQKGKIIMNKFDKADFLSASPNFNSLMKDTIVWEYANLLPSETRYIYIVMKAPLISDIPIGDSIKTIVNIYPTLTDTVKSDNTFMLKEQMLASFDPNDKSMITGNHFTTDQVKNGEYLTYLIRFQNTGTFKAFNIMVQDTLDDQLDLGTFEMISASHEYKLKINDSKRLEWLFDNIMLPDSSSDEKGSHGFICYRIKPKRNLVKGNKIKNTAYIYFDYNAPVVTNTSLIPIEDVVITNSEGNSYLIDAKKLIIYPNPFNQNITIQHDGIKIKEFKIMNILGETIYSDRTTNDGNVLVMTNQLSSGMYILQIISDKEAFKLKIVKN